MLRQVAAALNMKFVYGFITADILIHKGLKKEVFTWGSKRFSNIGDTCAKYLNAIYEADNAIFRPPLEFVRF